MATLPQVLAGPLVRRVDAKQVHLWIATSERLAATAEIFTLPKDRAARESTLADEELRAKYLQGNTSARGGWSTTVKLGKNLFVSMCRVTPTPGKKTFPQGELLFYDLRLETKPLSEFGLMGAEGITYAGAPLPAFFIPEHLTNLLHGSCHKLHGGGEDARAYADHRIAETFEDVSQRPAVLLLTGDQIYGDDVAKELSQPLAELAQALLGYDELLPGRSRPLAKLLPTERGTIARDDAYCGFKSGNADYHALGFGEFAGLHLLSWSPGLWGRFNVRQAELWRAQAASGGFRRVLANVATYMMFDDHDVTDDWNIDQVWKDRVSRLKIGRRVVANALAAYWAFQGWGNDPDAFDRRTFIDVLERYLAGSSRLDRFDDLLWSHPRWMYVTPTSPAILALDLRTRRAPDRLPPNAAEPLALTAESRKEIQTALAASGFRKQQPLIVISSLPVVGFAPVEALQAEYSLRKKGEAGADWEGWPHSLTGRPRLFRFLKNVVQPSLCIFLSGDVHYGFAATAAFLEPNTSNELPILQLTSSSLKNEDFQTLQLEDEYILQLPRGVIEVKTGVDLSNREKPLLLVGWDSPPRSERIERLRQEIALIVSTLLNPATSDRERRGLTDRQIQIAEELSPLKALLRGRPVILTPKQLNMLEIRDTPSWFFFYSYDLFSDGHLGVGRTNIGRVRLELPETIHHTLVIASNGAFTFRDQVLTANKVEHGKSFIGPDPDAIQ